MDEPRSQCVFPLEKKASLLNRHSDIELMTSLMMAALNGHVSCVNAFVLAGSDVNTCDSNGTSALHHSAFFGHEDCVHRLLQAGADVNIQNSEGITPLNEAALLCQFQFVDLLLKAAAVVKNEKWSSLIAAVTYEDEIIQYVIEKVKQVYEPEKHNQSKCTKLLIDAGVNVNATDERHNNALI